MLFLLVIVETILGEKLQFINSLWTIQSVNNAIAKTCKFDNKHACLSVNK